MNTAVPLLVFDEVAAGYTEVVVGPVSFSVRPGESVGLAGPNGSGKSTLVGALLGRARVFSGRIELAPGLRVSVQRQHPVRLSEMPLTGREVLSLTGATGRPLPKAIQPFVELRVDRLSGGQYQLIHVWACLGAPADLVILDEPTSNMDPHSRNSLIEILAEILTPGDRPGQGVVVISHDQDFLSHVTSRVVRTRR